MHIDTWGPYHTKAHSGHRYFLTIDDLTRATWTHLIVTKDEAISDLKSFVIMIVTQFNAHIKIIRSDNAHIKAHSGLFVSSDTCKGKAAYIQISPDPA